MKLHSENNINNAQTDILSDTDSEYSSFSIDNNSTDQENLSKTIDYLRSLKYALKSANYAYEFATDKLEKEDKSEAQINDESRYKYMVNSINNTISAYDSKISKYGSDLDKYLNFLSQKTFAENSDITSEDIQALKSTLTEENRSNSMGSSFKEKFFSVARKVTSFAAGFIVKAEDVKKYRKLSKDKQKKIELLEKFIALEQNDAISVEEKKEQYENLNGEFIALTREEQNRSKRSVFRILATQINNEKLFSTETVSKITSSIMHPFTKIANNKDMGFVEKSARVAIKVGEKGMKAGKYIVGEALSSGRSTVRDVIKHPVMAVYRIPMAMVNTVEAAIAQANALNEEDLTKKAELQERANQKLRNIAYQGEQGLRESVASGVSAGVAIANAGSFGAPIIATHAAAAAIHGIAAASEALDNFSTAKEGFDHLLEAAEEISKVELTKAEKTRGRRGHVDLSAITTFDANAVSNQQADHLKPLTAAQRMQAALDHAAKQGSAEEIHPLDTPKILSYETNSKSMGHGEL